MKSRLSSNKPDCYQCKWRRNIPGDAHSACVHPAVRNYRDLRDVITAFFDGRLPGVLKDLELLLDVEAVQHGIENGWFFWPVNFDPVWLLSCKGFEPIE